MKLIVQGPTERSRGAAVSLSSPCAASRQRGIALVITLILLAIITFMAIAFLVLSSGQRNAVVGQTDQNLARYGADAAQARALADLLSTVLISTNPSGIGLKVSTYYANPDGFAPGVSSPTNVNYDFVFGTGNNPVPTPLTPDQRLQNLTNLMYDPAPPVFITNIAQRTQEFRRYLDFNRNGRFDPTGLLFVTNSLGQRINVPATYVVGDPQWIGGLEFPDRNHSPDNPFIYRFSYIVMPTSQTMDINYIYNYAKHYNPAMGAGSDSFFRNQGVGTWEANLAAFLVDLNTNVWQTNAAPYQYFADPATYTQPNRGVAFDDALAVLKYRYANRWSTLSSALAMFGSATSGTLFGNAANNAFYFDDIDGYSAGPPMTNTLWPGAGLADYDKVQNRVIQPWSGAYNTNHFSSVQELLDPAKTGLFATRLQNAGLGRSSYDQNTFYRLLSSIGTESAPEDAGKINLNYDNIVQPNRVTQIVGATNFIPWIPQDFFTNTAIKLLANAGYTVGTNGTITNLHLLVADSSGRVNLQIPVFPVNYYTPSVHRLFQLAANIYDATTNRPFVTGQNVYPYCPTVFRPLFEWARVPTGYGTNANVVFITGFREVTNTFAPPMVQVERTNLTGISMFRQLGSAAGPRLDTLEPMVWGVPLVVGAKKGLPNFNEFAMQTGVFVSRLLEFRRDPTRPKGPIVETNQMYVFGITNSFGLEAWNSYRSNYTRQLRLVGSATMTAELYFTNVFPNGTVQSGGFTNTFQKPMNLAMNGWQGWTTSSDLPNSFVLPWGNTNQVMFLTNSSFVAAAPWFVPLTHIFLPKTPTLYVPHVYMNVNTRLLYMLVDRQSSRIVDYVNLNNWQPGIDVMSTLAAGATCSGNPANYGNPAEQWCTNINSKGVPYGVLNQIGLCAGLNGSPNNPPPLPNINSFNMDPSIGVDSESAIDGFRYNLSGGTYGPVYPSDQNKQFYLSNVFYAPFDPYQPVYVHTPLQANDPLVHYTVGDLTDMSLAPSNRIDFTDKPISDNLGKINTRYEPWGGNPFSGSQSPTKTEIAVKDPLVTRSDDWDFPANKFPNVGWLGRVHRGTPWQTVYLKSPNILVRAPGPIAQNFANWQWVSGNPQIVTNFGQIDPSIVPFYDARRPVPFGSLPIGAINDAIFSLPTNDWRILDLFTTAFNDNATRGQLSVNNTNLAAWSAILSGVNVLPDVRANGFIAPAGVYDPTAPPPLVKLVNGIINARTNFPNATYQRLGDVLAAPELTVNSPYINTNSPQFLSDDVYERIPQQVLGLLRGGEQPRFVIYAYGQALKPAVHSIVTGGAYLGLCTNYQITAEVATRSVIRVDGAQPVAGQPYHPHVVIENFNVLPPD